MLVRLRTPSAGELRDGLVEVAGVDVEARAVVLDVERVDAGEPVEPRRLLHRLDRDRGAREVAQLGQRAGLDRLARADDRHAVAQLLDLGEDVAREQHRPPRLARLLDAGLEDRLLQRVEAGGRLVEHEQLGVGRERGDERDLLPVALRVRAALLRRVELEALEQLGAPPRVEPAAQAAEQVDRLAAGQRRPQVHVAGDVGEPPVQRHRVGPRVAAEHPRLSPGLAQQPEQDADRGRLARPVGPEEAVDLAGGHLEVEPVERAEVAERLDEAGDLDRRPAHPTRRAP